MGGRDSRRVALGTGVDFVMHRGRLRDRPTLPAFASHRPCVVALEFSMIRRPPTIPTRGGERRVQRLASGCITERAPRAGAAPARHTIAMRSRACGLPRAWGTDHD